MSFQNANEWRHTLFECMISRLLALETGANPS